MGIDEVIDITASTLAAIIMIGFIVVVMKIMIGNPSTEKEKEKNN